METRVKSSAKEVIIGDDQPTVIIGERINPSANKKLAEALKTGNMEEIVRKEAVAQVEAGADMIDVNVGAFGVDEVALLPHLPEEVARKLAFLIALAHAGAYLPLGELADRVAGQGLVGA